MVSPRQMCTWPLARRSSARGKSMGRNNRWERQQLRRAFWLLLFPRTSRAHLREVRRAPEQNRDGAFAAVPLKYDLATASNDGAKSTEGFDGKGDALPAEMLPAQITFNDVRFQLAAAQTGTPNALVAKGPSDRPAGGPLQPHLCLGGFSRWRPEGHIRSWRQESRTEYSGLGRIHRPVG